MPSNSAHGQNECVAILRSEDCRLKKFPRPSLKAAGLRAARSKARTMGQLWLMTNLSKASEISTASSERVGGSIESSCSELINDQLIKVSKMMKSLKLQGMGCSRRTNPSQYRDKMTDMVKHLILKVLSSSQDQTVARSKGAFGPITSRLSLRELRQKDP
ncbi:hypothetical protein V1477_010203 [Vespula maculifrons]|uniref:Uncharacterized protein n=3 Tax=Vespula TaxID=7451 RepID=A0A834KTX3_VESVU|nr:hypothetical protein HZH66_000868 [Vespula vulgaris]